MARIWKEAYDGRQHGKRSMGPVSRHARNLIKQELICVNVCSFTFRFVTKEEIADYIEYYERTTHPSSRIPAKTIAADIGPDWRELRSWEVERWFERLPMHLLEEPKRQKVLKALHKTLALVKTGKL